MKNQKRLNTLFLFTVLLLVLLNACGTDPVETTVPPTTVPTITEPIATEPEIPGDYVCLDDLIVGSDITITVCGPKIYLSEDDLTLVMSVDHKDVYRDIYIMGVMKGNPIVQDGAVYIHGDFFRYFFCKEGTDRISLFHSVLFFREEIRTALKNPDRSPFNAKLCAEICRPQSMGVVFPNIDTTRIFLDYPLHTMATEKHEKLRRYGYTGEYLSSEYDAIINGQTLKSEGISDDDIMTVGAYNRLEQERKRQEFLNNQLTEEERTFLKQKGICPADYEFLHNWFGDSLTQATDEDLIEAIESLYRSNLAAIDTSLYEAFIPLEPTTSPAEIAAQIANLQNMDEMQRKEWFYEFAQIFRLDYMPYFHQSVGPSSDPREYLFWIYAIHQDTQRGRDVVMTTEFVDETVRTYFGITPGMHQTYEYAWIFDEATQRYTIYPAGSMYPATYLHYLLDRIAYVDGIYTVHATQYHFDREPSQKEMLDAKTALLQGEETILYPYAAITVSFRLDPETRLPVFFSYTEESLVS